MPSSPERVKLNVLVLLLGLAVLTAGAELLVRSASALARSLRISPVIVGLTIVAYGTSTPELVVSLQSSLTGEPDIALGNVVGSNIFNVLFILGLCALIIPLRVAQRLIQIEVPLMIGVSIAAGLIAFDGRVARWEGLLLLAGLVLYTIWIIRRSGREADETKAEYAAEYGPSHKEKPVSRPFTNFLLVVAGLVLLIIGSRWFTDAAVTIALELGISELVIGLTIVAAGTSLPEVAASVVAACRGERDIAVANVVGSNIFNILGVLGLSSCVTTDGIAVAEAALVLDIPVMIAVALACFPIFLTGHVIARWEGGLFLAYFCVYTAYLFAAATSPVVTRSLAVVLLGVVVPLTVITLIVAVIRYIRGKRPDDSTMANSQ